jgi:hypothetical protein
MSNTKVIYKYALLPRTGESKLFLPPGAEILGVGMQDVGIVIWALVDPHRGYRDNRTFAVVGTGWEFSADSYLAKNYLGNVSDGSFVWHIFEVTK